VDALAYADPLEKEGMDMGTIGLDKVIEHLHKALRPLDLTDKELLARFVAARDEAAFAALVRRHGGMVLGACRRLLRHEQDAEDAFQATFLVLANKAGSARWSDTVAPWLYEVANRIALEAKGINARRRSRERQVEDMPHPEVAPAPTQDWRPLLDEELGRLPEKYRAAIVLCDLEGQSRRAAARQLGVPEGTLSSRLARGHAMLAGRLSRRGLAISGAALAALAEGAASAQVPAALVCSTTRAAALVAAGQLAAVTTPAAVLMRGALKAMLMAKLKLVVGTVLVAAALGAGGLAYRAGPAPVAAQAPRADRKDEGKPANELEALRKENELLKLNLQIVLEKVRAQEAAMRTLQARAASKAALEGGLHFWRLSDRVDGVPDLVIDPLPEVEAALKALRSARDKEAKRKAADALEKATKKLRDQLK
jgi:RNA polymerase sigma factor (sigma-70 family)